MTNVTTLVRPAQKMSGDVSVQIAAVLHTMDELLCSGDLTVVFSSVVRICVPVLCDVAIATISVDGRRPYTIRWPAAAIADRATSPYSDGDEPGYRVLVPVRSRSLEPADRFTGTLELQCDDYRPSPSHELLAHLVAERATAVVDQERLAERARMQQARGDNLELGMSSNREIGIAMGIVMSGHKLTSTQAFDLLRRISQRTQRKVRDIALDVIESGMIDLPRDVALIDS
jgi:ANTAR domain